MAVPSNYYVGGQEKISKRISARRSAMVKPDIVRGAQPTVPVPPLAFACMAGLLATVGHTLVCYVAPLFGMPAVNISGILGSPLFSQLIPPSFTHSWLAGMGFHFTLGALVFPAAYVVGAHRLLPGSQMTRALLWSALLWAFGQLVVMPALGMGNFFQNLPQAIVTYSLAHLVYGVVFGAVLNSRSRAIY